MYRLVPKKSVIKFIEKRIPKEQSIIKEKLKILRLNPLIKDKVTKHQNILAL